MTTFVANITLTLDVEKAAAEFGASPDEIAQQIELCRSEKWLDDVRDALREVEDGPGFTWAVRRG